MPQPPMVSATFRLGGCGLHRTDGPGRQEEAEEESAGEDAVTEASRRPRGYAGGYQPLAAFVISCAVKLSWHVVHVPSAG